MTKLTLRYLGSFQATLDGTALTHFHSVKVQALLAYLAVEADRPHTGGADGVAVAGWYTTMCITEPASGALCATAILPEELMT